MSIPPTLATTKIYTYAAKYHRKCKNWHHWKTDNFTVPRETEAEKAKLTNYELHLIFNITY
jgi:hypothetical protein